MTLNAADLRANLDIIEQVEKANGDAGNFRFPGRTPLRFLPGSRIWWPTLARTSPGKALDRQGMPSIPVRLFGKVDYKRATYLFQPDYAVRQALFVDSKAEKTAGAGTATIQTSQTSMWIRQIRQQQPVDVPGDLDSIAVVRGSEYLTTTIFVKYNYTEKCRQYAAEPTGFHIHPVPA